MSSSELIQIEAIEGGVALIRLNRPAARNAMNAELATATIAAIEKCQSYRAIVITGADPAFCAGLDLRNSNNSLVNTARSGLLDATLAKRF